MKVHTVRVSFTREKQPKDYEKSAPAIEFSAAIDDNENHLVAGMRLMADATKVVYAALAMDVPVEVAAKLAVIQLPEGGTLIGATSVPKLVEVAATTGAEVTGTKKRGRPVGSVSIPKPRENITEMPPHPDYTDPNNIPNDGPVTTAAVVKPVASTTDVAGIPDDKPAAPVGAVAMVTTPVVVPGTGALTHGDLQTFLVKQITSKAIEKEDVKTILGKFGASRVIEVKPEQLAQVKQTIQDKINLKDLKDL